jgi:hypothetical protein
MPSPGRGGHDLALPDWVVGYLGNRQEVLSTKSRETLPIPERKPQILAFSGCLKTLCGLPNAKSAQRRIICFPLSAILFLDFWVNG